MTIQAAGFAATVTTGPLLVAMGVAALVGLISFVSPCVLPLVPGYLSYVAGIAGESGGATVDASQPPGTQVAGTQVTGTQVTGTQVTGTRRGRVVAGAALFVLGFTAVFVSYGALFGGAGRALAQYSTVITRVLGAITIVLGVAFLGKLPFMQRQWRIHRLPATGLAGAPLLGIVFGLGWTPCLGPTLGAVQTLAYNQASAWRGALLGVAYCIGLGVPFLLVAIGAGWVMRASSFARMHSGAIMRVGGIMLILLGVLLVTGLWDSTMQHLRSWFAQTGLGSDL